MSLWFGVYDLNLRVDQEVVVDWRSSFTGLNLVHQVLFLVECLWSVGLMAWVVGFRAYDLRFRV